MKIENFEVIDRCLYWPDEKMLILGDLHLGYENLLSEQGTSIPLRQLSETIEILGRVFKNLKNKKVEKIVILGDVKHHFGGILRQEIEDFVKLVNFFEKENENIKIIITKGNHDNIFNSFINKNLEVVDYLFEKGVLFFHGDSKSLKKSYEILKSKEVKLVVVGHFHPAYILKEKNGEKQEKYKCFVYGFSSEYNKKIIFVPSFFPLIVGSDIFSELEITDVKTMKKILIDEQGNLYKFKY
jgi:hypothetical protein